MINLISPKAKKKLLNEYRMRLGVIVLCALFLLELFTAMVFSPTIFSLRLTEASLRADLETTRSRLPENTSDIEAEVASIKNEIALLRPKLSATSTPAIPSELLSHILENKPKGIAVSAVAFQKDKDTISIQLSGVANTREDILAFKNALSKNPRFVLGKTNDYIIKKTDISFTVTLTIK
jgi:hypothetical protein